MIIVHESMQAEAESVSEVLKQVFGLESKLIAADLSNVFVPVQDFDAYATSDFRVAEYLRALEQKGPKESAMILTSRDLYAGDSKEDDWILGYNIGKFSVVTAARLKGETGEVSDILKIPASLYLARVNLMAVHEFGHDAVKAAHFQQAAWVNAETGHMQNLGPHCTNNSCAMYEIVDIKAPKQEEGYMLLGNEKRFDAGLDDVIGRLNPNFFCGPCKDSIVINDK